MLDPNIDHRSNAHEIFEELDNLRKTRNLNEDI